MLLIKKELIQPAICTLTIAMITLSGWGVSVAADPSPDAKEASEQKPATLTAKPTAIAHFPESKFEFDPTVEGLKVTHNFVIQNKGEAILKINGVKTSCGCTVASHPKQIPVGGEGDIKVQFNTSGYGGNTVHKTISVATNDPKQPQKILKLSGKVVQFATITPQFARLIGTQGEKLAMDVTIKPDPSYLFKIKEIKLKENKNVTCTLVEPRKAEPSDVAPSKAESTDATTSKTEPSDVAPAKTESSDAAPSEAEAADVPPEKYVLHIENTRVDPGRYADAITIRTDSKIKPKITIGIYGYIKEKSSK